MSVDVHAVMRYQLGEHADVLGRLRRRLADDEYGLRLLDRACGCVETLIALVEPTAAELYSEYVAFCGDEDVAVEEALRIVDERVDRLRSVLGARKS